MDKNTQSALIYLGIMCIPIVLALIVGLLSPRSKDPAKKYEWKTHKRPKDHRDYLFTGQDEGVSWEMEYYFYEHYRVMHVRHIPYTKVIVWTTETVSLPDSTLVVYPCRDKIKHLAHPRLIATGQTRVDDSLLDLPQRSVGDMKFEEQFVIRTDIDAMPQQLIVALRTELMGWSKVQLVGPIILADKNGIVIWWIPIGMKREYLNRTVKLGLALARSL